jgi:lipid-binding SYLF domain-containing protein
MKGQLDQALRVLSELQQAEPSVRDPQIAALKQAKGIVFMTQIKAGFFVSATAASGFIISRTPDGSWSAPSSLGAAGLGMGLQAGAQSTDIIIALSTDDAVERLMNSGRLSFGGEAEFTVPDGLPGPSHVGESNIGPAVGGNNGGFRAYSRAHGVFGGISIDGMALLTRDGDNASVYGKGVTVHDIMSGQIRPPVESAEFFSLLGTLLAEPRRVRRTDRWDASDGDDEREEMDEEMATSKVLQMAEGKGLLKALGMVVRWLASVLELLMDLVMGDSCLLALLMVEPMAVYLVV